MTHSEAIQEVRRRKDAGELYRKIVARYRGSSLRPVRIGLRTSSAGGAGIGRSRRGSAELARVRGGMDQGAIRERLVTIDERIGNRRLDRERSQ